MPDRNTIVRTCPHCDARYKIVRIEADPGATYREITCKSCGAPLPGKEGNSILKYFLIGGRKGGTRRTSL